MTNTTVNHHGRAKDRFEVYVKVEQGPKYAVIHLRDREDGVAAVTIFTPSGVNCAADYLREFRDAINGAIAKLEEMGAVKEAE